eukprot:14503896-Alexandrium_andersonii.AAC.1
MLSKASWPAKAASKKSDKNFFAASPMNFATATNVAAACSNACHGEPLQRAARRATTAKHER